MAGTVLTTPIAEYQEHFRVNALGPLILFKCFWPLLDKSSLAHPKFIITSTAGASIAMIPMITMPIAAYGMSKIAVNYMAEKLADEQKGRGLIVVPIHPGMSQLSRSRPCRCSTVTYRGWS